MEFLSHQHNKYTGIKGFVRVYNDAIKYRYMITKKALERARILIFQEKHDLCQKAFPYSFNFLYVLTDNGSEFKKHFTEELKRLHLTHYHTYPRTPKMNAHVERFNRTIQEEFIDYHAYLLKDPDVFNHKLMDYLIFYNTKRAHYAFQNKLSPVQFMLSLPKSNIIKMPQECGMRWGYTASSNLNRYTP